MLVELTAGATVPAGQGEGHEREVDRVEHQFDAHEDDDRVAPGEYADGPDREQHGGEIEVVVDAHCTSPPISSMCGRAADTWRCSGTLPVATLPSGSRA